ncbi:unnamed protein product [Knipowitschia caucasica]
MAPYADKVVIVTGGSKGIGRGIVTSFMESGSKVVFCARGSAAGEALEAELNSKGPGCCMFLSCDMSKEEDVQRLVSFTLEQFGHIDCLVNNAGWHPPHKPTDQTSTQDLRDLLEFNLVSYFLTSKGAIISMTKAMAVDESRYGVRVNSLSPGNVMTPLWAELAAQTPDAEAAIREGENNQLLGRMGTPAECGAAAVFLAEATFCTGIDLLLSGGAELNYGYKNTTP